MGAIVVVLLLALALAAVIMLYVAYPYRGEDTPLTPRLGRDDAARASTPCRRSTARNRTVRPST